MTSPTIALSGIIGAGKSTLAEALGRELSLPVYNEPVVDNPYLAPFYADMAKHAFALQVYLLNARFRQQQQLVWSAQGGVQDRSIYEDTVFARMLHDRGLMSSLDYETYMSLFCNMTNLMRAPSMIVYLDVTPEQALANIRQRGRECERDITLEYLRALHTAYERFLSEISRTTPVIRIDNSTFPSVDKVAEAVKAQYEQAFNVRLARV